MDKKVVCVLIALAVLVIIMSNRIANSKENLNGAKCINKDCVKYVYGPKYWHLTGSPDTQYIASGLYRLPHKNKVWDTDADIKRNIGISQ